MFSVLLPRILLMGRWGARPVRSVIAVAASVAVIGGGAVWGPGIIGSGGSSGPGTANLWIDTNGGTCTRQGTPSTYTDAAACSSFTTAYNAASGGDTIKVKCGTYAAQTVPNRSLGTSIVTIEKDPDDGGCTRITTTGDVSVGSSYVTVSGINAGNHFVGADINTTDSQVCPRTYVTLDNIVVAGDAASMGGGCDHITISNSDISGTNVCTGGGNEDSIIIIGNDAGSWGDYIPTYITIENTTVRNQGPANAQCGAHADGYQSPGCRHCVFEGNTFYDTNTSTIIIYDPGANEVDSIQDIDLINNYFGSVNDAGHGVSIGGQPCTGQDATNLTFVNNTFALAPDWNCDQGVSNATFVGNIFISGDSYSLCSAFPATRDYNVFVGISGCGTNFKQCTPSWTDGSHTNGNYDIQTGDTCAKDYVPNGSTTNVIDIHGTVRPQGSAKDAGGMEVP